MFFGDSMTNKELYLKIKQELGNKYCIGLHNSTRFTWYEKAKFYEIYDINGGLVNEEFIISNILKKGLYIPDRIVGVRSTVTILDRVNEDCFNYSYYHYLGSDKVYVLIIAIPKKIEIEGEKYFISDMINNKDITSYSLFNLLLPREFIYGYYMKNVRYEEKITDESWAFCWPDSCMPLFLPLSIVVIWVEARSVRCLMLPCWAFLCLFVPVE